MTQNPRQFPKTTTIPERPIVPDSPLARLLRLIAARVIGEHLDPSDATQPSRPSHKNPESHPKDDDSSAIGFDRGQHDRP